jgi:aromatic-L-amino-acid decarboxylase
MRRSRISPVELTKEEFREIGHKLVDDIADMIESIGERPVTPGESPEKLKEIIGNSSLPEKGTSPSEIFSKATNMLFDHSLFNGHPRFLGYITSSPAPVCALADMLASAVNPNAGAQILSPAATEIEKQTVRWLAEFIGVKPSYGGLLVSGGTMANLTAFLTGLKVKGDGDLNSEGLHGRSRMVVYCSTTTHTWIEKAARLAGRGPELLRWIETDKSNRMDNKILELAIKQDIKNGFNPVMVVGTAGDVSTGVVDDLKGIAAVCKKYNLWFHIDGAYGIPAAVIPELGSLFEGVEDADSIALDPHKWLYSSLEAGCTLVKNPRHLYDTFSTHPTYYNFDTEEEGSVLNYYEYGLQNSRGFRALKVWIMLQHVGKIGYIDMIRDDIMLSELLYSECSKHPELESITQNLSITTFRYVPGVEMIGSEQKEAYLNRLNEALLNKLQAGGEVFLSNALVKEKYCLRGCIVNFRTSREDIFRIIEIVVREGRQTHLDLQAEEAHVSV